MPYNCLLTSILLATQGLYGFTWNPISSISFLNLLLNTNTEVSIPYNAFTILTYRIGESFCLLTYMSCVEGSNLVSIFINWPLIFMIISFWSSLLISVWTKALGMSTVIKSLFCFASVVLVIRTLSMLAVGLAASSFGIYVRWMLPFAHVLALILPSFFSVRKMRTFHCFTSFFSC